MIGYKIIVDQLDKSKRLLATLSIPEDAKTTCKRSNLQNPTFAKYRCDKAIVTNIEGLYDNPEKYTQGVSAFFEKQLIYNVGEMVNVEDFNENIDIDCSRGIHFFLDKDYTRIFGIYDHIWKSVNKNQISIVFKSIDNIPMNDHTVILYYNDGSFSQEITIKNKNIIKLVQRNRLEYGTFMSEYIQDNNIITSINKIN
jgi:hypothetical protein